MEKCPICLEEFKEGDNTTTTQCCAKLFHTSCIEKVETLKCPLCRADLPNPTAPYNLVAIVPYIDLICCPNHDFEGGTLGYHAVNTLKKVYVTEMLTKKDFRELRKHHYITQEALKQYNLKNLYAISTTLQEISERNLVVHLDNRVSSFLDYENHVYILSGAEMITNRDN